MKQDGGLPERRLRIRLYYPTRLTQHSSVSSIGTVYVGHAIHTHTHTYKQFSVGNTQKCRVSRLG